MSAISAARGPDLHREAGVAEHADHPVVAREHGRRERVDPLGGRGIGELREQDRGDPVPLPVVGDRERDLGAAGALRA